MVKFYGKIDTNQYGKIGSEVPAWAMTAQIEDLQEEIDSKERALERGSIPIDLIPQTKEELRKLHEKLDVALESKPKISDPEKDDLWKIYKEMGKDIADTMFTRSDMNLGLASAHEEMRRMKEPIIKIKSDMVELCEANGISVCKKDNSAYISRDNASKLWKIIGKFLDEPSNVEVLRKDKNTAK